MFLPCTCYYICFVWLHNCCPVVQPGSLLRNGSICTEYIHVKCVLMRHLDVDTVDWQSLYAIHLCCYSAGHFCSYLIFLLKSLKELSQATYKCTPVNGIQSLFAGYILHALRTAYDTNCKYMHSTHTVEGQWHCGHNTLNRSTTITEHPLMPTMMQVLWYMCLGSCRTYKCWHRSGPSVPHVGMTGTQRRRVNAPGLHACLDLFAKGIKLPASIHDPMLCGTCIYDMLLCLCTYNDLYICMTIVIV